MEHVSPSVDRWYFAYGSNLSIEQKQDRTGRIRSALPCRLPGYRLAFNKVGSARSAVFANIVPCADAHVVWGVAYLCNADAFAALDRYEGVGSGHYRHLEVSVICEDGGTLDAITYVAGDDFICAEAKPAVEYLNLIISGARHHGLPARYIDAVQKLGATTPE